MEKFKLSEKITLCYFGDANAQQYKTKTMTVKAFKKYKEENNRKVLNDIAFILKGVYNNVIAYEIKEKKYSVHDII